MDGADSGEQQAGGAREQSAQVRAAARERMVVFEREMQRGEEEALRGFKEGLRRAVGAR